MCRHGATFHHSPCAAPTTRSTLHLPQSLLSKLCPEIASHYRGSHFFRPLQNTLPQVLVCTSFPFVLFLMSGCSASILARQQATPPLHVQEKQSPRFSTPLRCRLRGLLPDRTQATQRPRKRSQPFSSHERHCFRPFRITNRVVQGTLGER